ncbi:MAG TPA: hypothetical protein VGH05_01170 [Buttiauxella sp.]|jgi:uncharacterized membrane protein YeaQ/YmgE (transglycosylase-associated protein family)
MGLLIWVIIGVLVGLAANALRPAPRGGFAVALVMAVTGSLIGGYVCAAFNIGTLATVEPKALLAAALVSALFVFVFQKLFFHKPWMS